MARRAAKRRDRRTGARRKGARGRARPAGRRAKAGAPMPLEDVVSGTPGYAFEPPRGQEGVEEVYGAFDWQDAAKGSIVITDGWAQDNVVFLRRVCGLPLHVQLHRLVAPLFEVALADALVRCPDYEVRMLGGFVPRHKMNDPSRGLSIHSWGAAFDVNWDTNGVGRSAPTDLPAEFVAAFTERGWDWGGGWRTTRDWMHFQYATGV